MLRVLPPTKKNLATLFVLFAARQVQPWVVKRTTSLFNQSATQPFLVSSRNVPPLGSSNRDSTGALTFRTPECKISTVCLYINRETQFGLNFHTVQNEQLPLLQVHRLLFIKYVILIIQQYHYNYPPGGKLSKENIDFTLAVPPNIGLLNHLNQKPCLVAKEDKIPFNPFAPETPVTARADPRPFYPL